MAARCPSCRFDPGFDALVCPRCGTSMDGRTQAAPASPVIADTIHASDYRPPSDHTVLANESTVMARRTGGRGCFIALAGPDRGTRFLLQDLSLVGRGREATVRLADPRVSERHAQVKWAAGRFVFQDLQATNGSYLLVDGQARRLKGVHSLRDNDEVQLGSTVLRFVALKAGGNP